MTAFAQITREEVAAVVHPPKLGAEAFAPGAIEVLEEGAASLVGHLPPHHRCAEVQQELMLALMIGGKLVARVVEARS